MIDSVYLSIQGIYIFQILMFYNIFVKYDRRNFFKYKYKNVVFNYFTSSKCLYIRTEVDKIIGRKIVTLEDKKEFLDKLITIIMEFVDIKREDIKFKLCRIDYKVDLQLTPLEMSNIFTLLNKHRTRFKYLKSTRKYKTSISLSGHTAGTKINIYDKGEQSNLPEYTNILRVELQNRNRKLHRILKNKGIERDIDLYWSKEFMEDIYFKFYEEYLYLGKYYKLGKAKEIIEKSSYTKTIKKGLINFVDDVNKFGMTRGSKKYSYNTTRRYVSYLNELNVNPITINDDCNIDEIENLLVRAREVAERKYFNI